MVPELKEKLRKAGLDGWDFWYSESPGTPGVSFETGRLKTIGSSEAIGLGVRVVRDGRIGFASCSHPTDWGPVVENAIASAQYGEKALFRFPGPMPPPPWREPDERIKSLSMQNLIDRCREAVQILQEGVPEMQIEAGAGTGLGRVVFANSEGQEAEYEGASYSISSGGLFFRGESPILVGRGHSRTDTHIDHVADAQEVVELVAKTEKEVHPPAGNYPVFFSPHALWAILQAFQIGLHGKQVQKGISPLKDRIGEKVAGDGLTLTDDPFLEGSPHGMPFDGDGLPTCKTVLIERGVVRSYVLDLQTAGLLGMESTASAGRGSGGLPGPSYSNIRVEPGSRSEEELIRSMGKGIYVEAVIGGGQSNLLMGEFSLNIGLGFWIENGEYVGRVKDTMVAGNVYEAFMASFEIASHPLQVGGYYSPGILLDGLSVVSGA